MMPHVEAGRKTVNVGVELPENSGIVWVSATSKNKPTVDINITVADE